MVTATRKQRLAKIRREIDALDRQLAAQQLAVTGHLSLLDDLQLGTNLHHSYEASVERQRHATRLGFVDEIEAEQLEQQLLSAAAEAFAAGGGNKV